MELLSKLGIDIKLIIAQIVNFGLLLFILSKLLYKPIINKIERDENEFKQAKKQKQELEKHLLEFEKRKKKEIEEARKISKEIIKEAENIAKTIKKDAKEKADEESKMLIRKAENKISYIIPKIEKEIYKKNQINIIKEFKKSFQDNFSNNLQKKFQQIFWEDLMLQIKKLDFKKINKANTHKKNKKRSNETVRIAILEYAFIPTKKQIKELGDIILEKIDYKLKIKQKQNKDLINGFRFEICGFLIETNLLNIIENASKNKKQ